MFLHFTMMLSVISAAGRIQVMNDFLEQIRQLPIPEQLLLVEKIWEGIPKNATIVQDWHREEGRRRLTELERDPSGTLSRADMWKRVDERVNE
jgi:putative addiction module component (TIGR02574 family)